MTESKVLLKVEDGVAFLTLNDPERLNALSGTLIADLHRELDRLDQDRSIRVVVLTGAGGRSFSAGGNLADIRHDLVGARAVLKTIESAFERLERLPMPVVAAVNGLAYGAGFGLALISDLVIASDRAKFCLPDAKMGNAPGSALVRGAINIGRRKLLDLSFLAEPIDAIEAKQIQLANWIVPHDDLMHEAGRLANRLKERAPISLEFVKEVVNRDLNPGDWHTLFMEIAGLWTSNDLQEGLTAFKAKRSPVFQGR
ncbi:MAG: enoyl-CoA hydratase/isomerase family protein [Chloroflexi bacterium]|nr:enoyl-CoA hydratase/isomerase family protein [Chloroflexota bacterium]